MNLRVHSNEGMALIKKGNKFGYINTKGSVVIEPVYEMATAFQEGFATVKLNGKMGVINKKKQKALLILNMTTLELTKMVFAIFENNGRFGLLNTKGLEN